VSSMAKRRPLIMVLGMHRSGTSLCSHVLSALGVDMVDEVESRFDNPRGHWERWEIVDLHDRILAKLNRSYVVLADTWSDRRCWLFEPLWLSPVVMPP